MDDPELIKELRKDNNKDRHQFISADGMYVYSIGIIDYLQNYNNEKHMEHLFKEWRQSGHSMEMSAVPPKHYSKRFFEFMSKHVIIN